MESIKINGEEWTAPIQNSLKMTELVELIKSTIDPSQIITGILLNGKDMYESWLKICCTFAKVNGVPLREWIDDKPTFLFSK